MALVRRDPFARVETHRRELYHPLGCSWCAGTNARGNVYLYRTEPDAGRSAEEHRVYCSAACRRADQG